MKKRTLDYLTPKALNMNNPVQVRRKALSKTSKKSRRDDTLLTVGKTYGDKIIYTPIVPHGTALMQGTNYKVSSLQDLGVWRHLLSVGYACASPTVNKMLSLRDLRQSIWR